VAHVSRIVEREQRVARRAKAEPMHIHRYTFRSAWSTAVTQRSATALWSSRSSYSQEGLGSGPVDI